MANKKKLKNDNSNNKETINKIPINKYYQILRQAGDSSKDNYYRKLYELEEKQGGKVSLSKKFRYSFPVLKKQFKTKEIEISNKETENYRFELKSFIFYNTNSFVSCLDQNKSFICAGLKQENTLLNIFEKKEGDSTILIFDSNLNLIKTIKETFGDVLQTVLVDSNLYVLFSNGFLVLYEDISNLISTNIKKIIEYKRKIIIFDATKEILAFTDGKSITINGITKNYDGIIIDIQICDDFIITLDVNGKIYKIDKKLENLTEIIAKYTITSLKKVDNALILFEDQNYNILYPHKELDSLFIHFFTGSSDGIILNHKKYSNKKKIKKMVEICKIDTKIRISMKEDEFLKENNEKIVDVKKYEDNFIFFTENGYIFKFFYY